VETKETQVSPEPDSRPRQAPPVTRRTSGGAISALSGMEACDNDHNTDTEHDLFFIKMS
jgi:hypothetical protein